MTRRSAAQPCSKAADSKQLETANSHHGTYGGLV